MGGWKAESACCVGVYDARAGGCLNNFFTFPDAIHPTNLRISIFINMVPRNADRTSINGVCDIRITAPKPGDRAQYRKRIPSLEAVWHMSLIRFTRPLQV
jgi:hypothetical protein